MNIKCWFKHEWKYFDDEGYALIHGGPPDKCHRCGIENGRMRKCKRCGVMEIIYHFLGDTCQWIRLNKEN